MNPTILFLVLSPLAFADGMNRLPPADVETLHDFGSFTVADAIRMEGERARFKLIVTSGASLGDGDRVFEVGFQDRDDLATVWLPPMDDGPAGAFTVEARLKVLWHAAKVGKDGQRFDGFWEVRLLEARRVEE